MLSQRQRMPAFCIIQIFFFCGNAASFKVIGCHDRFSIELLIIEIFIKADAEEGTADIDDIIKAVALQCTKSIIAPL